ncbi:MAG TPA: nuclear transport factor 2 family protein [Egibacteraceae bacterium]|nr:nuclear transport factor 2 family protein [Egibacteraceae bacterium]
MSTIAQSTQSTAERYSEALKHRDAAALRDVYHDDATVDCNVPQWRFELEGADAISTHLGDELAGVDAVTDVQVRSFDPSDWQAFEVEVSLTRDGQQRMYRELELVRIVDGRIAEHIAYCTGEWDADTIRKHRAQSG